MKPYVDISASFPVIITSELAVDYCKNNKVLSPSVRKSDTVILII